MLKTAKRMKNGDTKSSGQRWRHRSCRHAPALVNRRPPGRQSSVTSRGIAVLKSKPFFGAGSGPVRLVSDQPRGIAERSLHALLAERELLDLGQQQGVHLRIVLRVDAGFGDAFRNVGESCADRLVPEVGVRLLEEGVLV